VFLGVEMIEARKVTGRPTSIPQWAFGEVFRLRDLGHGCRRIVRSLEEAGVFTTRSSVSRLLNGQPPYADIEREV
jgi:hypothetical protein